MEANGKSYNTIKKELKETFYPDGKEQKFINGLLNKIIEDLQN